MALAENHDRGGRVAGGRRWTAAPLVRPVDKVPAVPALAGRLLSREKARLATARLQTLRPDLSSSTRLWRWQTVLLAMLAVGLGAALLLAPDELATVVTVVLALPFFSVYLLRFLALRQFTIEYSALFDLMLPALERYRLPVPLGGTSNHFRRAALQRVLAWDPYNVTEDADLGIRIARFGYRVGTINSTTWEEAPPRFRVWLGQRTRWLKGWMQTYLVHMRRPRHLVGELGWRGFAGLQVLMGAMIASALVHPWFYVLLAYKGTDRLFGSPAAAGPSEWLMWLALANLVLGYVSVVAVGVVAVWRRRRKRLAIHALFVPIYWLAISYAAYRALGQMVTAPFHWEKTRHRARRHGVKRVSKRGSAQSQPS